MCLAKVLEWENGGEAKFEEIIAENFSKLTDEKHNCSVLGNSINLRRFNKKNLINLRRFNKKISAPKILE